MEVGYWPSKGATKPTFAILQDLSGVVETSDGFGIFSTEEEALQALILRLESERTEVVDKIAKAKRRQRQLKKRKATA